MAWKKTTEDPDRYINTDNVLWVHVEGSGSSWDVMLYPQGGGTFSIGNYSSQAAAEASLALLIATF